jgi:thiamine biosynthesis lipoprotein
VSALALARRAQWQMGTLVEAGGDVEPRALDAAFAAIADVEARMSSFRSDSDLAHLNESEPGLPVALHAHTRAVLRFAADLYARSEGAFDVALGRGAGTCGYALDDAHAWRTAAGVRITLDGVAKGYAVDRAVDALRGVGAQRGWVNAGGDLRAFGDLDLPVSCRAGRASRTLALREGALATSEYGPRRMSTSASRLTGRAGRRRSAYGAAVLAADCMTADALAKVVAVAGKRSVRVVAQFGARVVWQA